MGKHNLKFTEHIFSIFNYTFLTIFMLLCIYPFYYILIYSISDPQLASKGLIFLPKGVTLFNFTKILSQQEIYDAALISVCRTLAGTALTVLCCSLFAFIVTKNELYFRKFIYRFMIITMYVGAGLIPFYLTIKAYHLRNSFLIYIIPSALNAFYVILMKTFIEQLPASLEESATIDGAGYLTVFFRIIFPLSLPIVATIAVFSSVDQWNAWFDAYIFITNGKLFTLQYLLLHYLQESAKLADMVRTTANASTIGTAKRFMIVTPESARMTVTMITLIPIILVYPFMQRYFVKGILIGAVKG